MKKYAKAFLPVAVTASMIIAGMFFNVHSVFAQDSDGDIWISATPTQGVTSTLTISGQAVGGSSSDNDCPFEPPKPIDSRITVYKIFGMDY